MFPSTSKIDEAPSSMTEGKEETEHGVPFVIANPTTQSSSKDTSDDLKSSNKPSANDDS
jgi:hypothetical protein